jgi:hypothetical protein
MSLLQSTSVINSPQAASADLSVNGGVINVTTVDNQFPAVRYSNIRTGGAGAVLFTGEQLQVTTVAFSAANNATYKLSVSQIINGEAVNRTFFYTSDSNATAAEICAAFVAQINASEVKITASGSGSPLTLTAQAGYPIFTVTLVANFTSQTTGTAGIAAAYTGDQLIALGVANALSGTDYNYWNFTYVRDLVSNNTLAKGEELEHTLFIAAGTDGDALAASILGMLDGTDATFFPQETNSVVA